MNLRWDVKRDARFVAAFVPLLLFLVTLPAGGCPGSGELDSVGDLVLADDVTALAEDFEADVLSDDHTADPGDSPGNPPTGGLAWWPPAPTDDETDYSDLRFEVEPSDGPPDLTIRVRVFSLAGEPLPKGTYTWWFDGESRTADMSTAAETTHTFRVGGLHVVRVTLAVAGLTVPIGCASGRGGAGDQAEVTVWPTVSGYVRDADGNPLPNVVVRVDGEDLSAVTDAAGGYHLAVPYESSGVIRPVGEGEFSPAAWSFERITGDLDGVDFTQSAPGPRENAPPTADPEPLRTDEDTPVLLSLAGSDPDGDPLTFVILSLPDHGLLVDPGTGQALGPDDLPYALLLGENRVRYEPEADYNDPENPDGFAYQADDGQARSPEAWQAVTVDPVNDPPTFDLDPPVWLFVGVPARLPLLDVSPGPADEQGQQLAFSATSSDPSVVPDENLVFEEDVLVVTPQAAGPVTITVHAHDDGGGERGGVDTFGKYFEILVVSGPVLSGTVQPPETAGATVPIGPVALMLSGSGDWAGQVQVVWTDASGKFVAEVPHGWTGTLAAADPESCLLTPEQLVFDTPVTEARDGQDLVAWRPPPGIPAPPFGLRETHWMYADATFDFGSGPEPYRDAGHGPYTHYVDNTHPEATDTDNPFGTPERPRLTIPYPLPPGSVVEVHGGPYAYHIHTDNFQYGGDRLPLAGQGSPDKPIFIRGVGPEERPVFADSTKPVRPEGCYLILENLDLRRPLDVRPKTDLADQVHHVAVRHCELQGFDQTAVHLGWPHGLDSHPEWRDPTLLTDVVLYDNRIHDLGDWEQTGSSEDYAGVFPHINCRRLWVLDNAIYHVDGDAIQINTWGIYDDPDVHRPPEFVYIGRNRLHECQENCLDFKVCRDVVVSQNAIYGIHDHSASSDGAAVVVHEDSGTASFPYPVRLWYVFNDIHDSDIGLRVQASDEVYIIGNTIHDIVSSYALLDSGYSSGAALQCWDNGTIYFLNNVVYGCDLGVLSANPSGALHLVNNLIAELTDHFRAAFGQPAYQIYINNSSVAQASDMRYNLLFESDDTLHLRWGGTYTTLADFQAGTGLGEGCLQEDPRLTGGPVGDFHLPSDSPAVDAGTEHPAYQAFFELYGLTLEVDRDGNPRPAPPTGRYDIGAYERAGQ